MPTAIKDPENHEIEYIRRYAPLEGSLVLDIGCGDGELTSRYANWCVGVIGVDPDLTRLRDAITLHSEAPSKNTHFAAARAEALPFNKERFDLVIFTSSL